LGGQTTNKHEFSRQVPKNRDKTLSDI